MRPRGSSIEAEVVFGLTLRLQPCIKFFGILAADPGVVEEGEAMGALGGDERGVGLEDGLYQIGST